MNCDFSSQKFMRMASRRQSGVSSDNALLRQKHRHDRKETKNQETDHPKPPLEPSTPSRLTSNQDELDPPLENRLNSPKGFDDGQNFTAIPN